MLGSQISSMLFVLGLVQVLRRFDLTTPEALFWVRIMYVSSQVLQLAAWFYVRSRVLNGKKEEATTMIEVTEPAKPFSTEPPKKERVSVRQYDLNEVNKNLQQVVTSCLILLSLHSWFKFVQPLVFQSILPWKNFFGLPVVQIRLLGWKAEGALARPWKAPNPFGDLLGQEEENNGNNAVADQKSKIELIESDEEAEVKPVEATKSPKVKARKAATRRED